MHNVSRREQMCYECRVPEYGDDSVVFHIVCCNFKVSVEGPTPFEDEVGTTLRSSTVSVINPPPLSEEITVQLVGRAADIADLRADGVEVDDEDPAPENAVPQPQPTRLVGEWEKQLVCMRRSNSAISYTIGVWKEKQ